MTAHVRNLTIQSDNPFTTATIVVTRRWTPTEPLVSDLPADVRAALLSWLLVSSGEDPRRPVDPDATP